MEKKKTRYEIPNDVLYHVHKVGRVIAPEKFKGNILEKIAHDGVLVIMGALEEYWIVCPNF